MKDYRLEMDAKFISLPIIFRIWVKNFEYTIETRTKNLKTITISILLEVVLKTKTTKNNNNLAISLLKLHIV